MTAKFLIANDNEIQLIGLADARGTYQNAGTVEVTIKDRDGAEVAGQTWPLTLSYVSGSEGDYRGVLDAALDVSVNDSIRAHVDVTAGGLAAHWEIQITAVVRKG